MQNFKQSGTERNEYRDVFKFIEIFSCSLYSWEFVDIRLNIEKSNMVQNFIWWTWYRNRFSLFWNKFKSNRYYFGSVIRPSPEVIELQIETAGNFRISQIELSRYNCWRLINSTSWKHLDKIVVQFRKLVRFSVLSIFRLTYLLIVL